MSGTGQPNPDDLRPIDWTEAEPTRLQRDLRDVADFNTAFGAALQYAPPGTALVGSSRTTPVMAAGRSDAPAQTTFDHGGWHGTLPLWPFDRHAPDGLDALTDGTGLEFTLTYPAAYPMVPPTIWPLAPQPEMVEWTQATWHVLPTGGLCLLQSDGAWQPEASLVDLLLKAAGWRVEYVLMKAHVIEAMAVSGIVSDSSFDHLVTQAATAPTTPGLPSGAVGTPSEEPTTDPENRSQAENPSQAQNPAQVEGPES